MKEIKAYIKAIKRESVTRALFEIEGLTGASYSDVLGFGRGKGKSTGYNPNADPSGYVRHVKVEVVCKDDLVEEVVETIRKAAHTGLRGDGKIYINKIEDAVRIQSGENGIIAI